MRVCIIRYGSFNSPRIQLFYIFHALLDVDRMRGMKPIFCRQFFSPTRYFDSTILQNMKNM